MRFSRNTPERSAARTPLAAAALGALLLVSIPACSPKPASAAPTASIGRWQTVDAKETFEFLTNGVCQGRDEYGRTIEGSYMFVDEDHVRLSLTVKSFDLKTGNLGIDHSAGVCRVQVNSDSLVLTDESGSAKKYRRSR